MKLAGVLLSGVLAGCAAIGMTKFQTPGIVVDAVTLRSVSTSGGTLDVTLNVDNPNRFDLKGVGLDLGLDVEGVHFGDARYSEQFQLPKEQVTAVTVPVSFTWAGVGTAARAILSRGEVEYRVDGTTRLQTPYGREQLPFTRTGTLSLGQPAGSGPAPGKD